MGIFGDMWEEDRDYYKRKAEILQEENAELKELIKLLTIVEVSDSGREFYPNKIQSCRVMDGKRITEIIEKYKD